MDGCGRCDIERRFEALDGERQDKKGDSKAM
jgi:hypothetical protein